MEQNYQFFDNYQLYIAEVPAATLDEAADKVKKLLSVRCAQHFEEEEPYVVRFSLQDPMCLNKVHYQCTYTVRRDPNSQTGWSTNSILVPVA